MIKIIFLFFHHLLRDLKSNFRKFVTIETQPLFFAILNMLNQNLEEFL